MKKYDDKIKAHSIIQWSIKGRNRYNLRIAQQEHDIKKLKKYIHQGWGLGSLTHFTTPFMKLLLAYVKEDPTIITKWIKMYFRYYQNWLHESYDYVKKKVIKVRASKRVRKKERKFLSTLRFIDLIMKSMLRIRRVLKIIIIPLSNSLNTLMRK